MKKNYYYLSLFVLLLFSYSIQSQTITQTYTAGDIPTSFNAFSATCNGPLTSLSIALPAGGPWEVTGFDVQYTMTAANVAWLSEQRSLIHFQNNGTQEASAASGTGNVEGTFSYNRNNIALANAYYAGGTNLIFEMRAWRTWGSTAPNDGCGTFYNKVNNNSWVITVHYQLAPSCIAPQNITVSNITVDEAQVNWTEIGTATEWTIEYGLEGFVQGTGTSVIVTSPTYLITGLTDLTDYDVYVRSNCAPGDLSAWAGPETFRTSADCSLYTLAITSTTPGSVVCKGITTLSAVGSGTANTEIFWYNAAVAGDRVGIGPTFTTPVLTATTSFWAAEVIIDGQAPLSGQAKPTYTTIASTSGSTWGLVFNAFQDFTIVDVEVYSTGAGGNITIQLQDNTGTMIEQATVTVPGGGSTTAPVPYTAQLNFDVPGAGTYRLINMTAVPMVREFSNNVFPYPLGTVGQVTSGYIGGVSQTYYWFYNWTIGTGQVVCESARLEVIATVTQDGDITVPSALPYIDANNNTSGYGNTFSGAPGTACGTTENYLNGSDVVYMYTPSMDDVIDIHLKDLTAFYAGLFVYQTCGDIGTNCMAGKVAGPSQNSISIEEFTVLAGQTYYIVVSSWLTSSVGYTLEINGFVCAAFPAPVGDASQNYAAPATLADLVVSGTMSVSVLTWYDDPVLLNILPDNTPLVDGTIYYVSQTFGTCESPLLAITVHEIDCSNLDIISTTDGLVICLGSMTLSAVGSGSGDEIYWYDAQTGGNLVGTGPTFTTPVLTASTSYWAAEVYLEQGSGGNVLPTPCIPVHGTSGCGAGDNIDNFVLSEAGGAVLINHIGTGCSPNAYGNFTGDPNLTAILIADSNYNVAMTHTWATSQWVKIWIDFDFDGVFDASELVFQSTSGSAGGVTNGTFSIPSNVIGSTTIMRVSVRFGALPDNACTIGGTWGETHDYKVTVVGSSALCESPREEVLAIVQQTGDITVGPLPYTDQNNTINYGNTFSGSTACAGVSGNYLNGNDVVYKFSPANDDIVTIELTGVSSNTGVFVYESCGDVGTNCIAGRVGIGKIEDFYVTGGQDYFIVIGSQSGSTAYTLDIYGFVCANLGAPTADSPQIYVPPATLADLTVNSYVHSTGLTWYSNSTGTLPTLPPSTPLASGTTYWVSQTVLGCESPLLAITTNELDCSVLGVVSTTGGVVCQQGQVTLTATPTGNGSEIYWFASQTALVPIAIGNQFVTPTINTTTSYWAAEVFLEQSTGGGGPLPSYCTSFGFTSGCGFGDDIDNFTIQDTSGMTILSHLGSGCSPNAYGDFTNDANLMFTLVAGQTYNFTATHNFGGQYLKIWIDFDKDGIFNNTNELLFQSPTGANPTIGSFTVPNDAIGNTTVMRVFDRWLALPTNACTSGGAYGEVHDYRVTVVGASILCESNRAEVVAEVNTTMPPAPTGATAQDFCGTSNTVANLQITGTNIKWYDAAGNLLPNSTLLVNGLTYYATQTVNACEGSSFEVAVTILDKSNKPIGDRNQPFAQGETLANLDVIGDNLLWYSDPLGNNPLPLSTLLVDQTTYYVGQTLAGFCESDKLDVKVHRVLAVDDIAFANLIFYPNPAQDYVTIINTGVIESVEVYSLLGQRVIYQNVGDLTSTIDVTRLASGPYLLTIIIDGKTGIYKLIKK